MRPAFAVAAILVAFLLGAFVEHTFDAPFGVALGRVDGLDQDHGASESDNCAITGCGFLAA